MRLLIKNGFLIDGSGSPKVKSDILIEDDKIVEIKQKIVSHGAKEIDASEKIVCPGFIDLHNHADLTILEANDAEAFVAQGMTTLLVSLCGIGVSPANEKVKDYYFNFVNITKKI